MKNKHTGGLSDHNAIILTLDWCKTPKGPGTFKERAVLQNDPVYMKTVSYIIKHSIASYISDKIQTLVSDSENEEANKDALLEARKKLETFDIPTNNTLLSEIEDHRKPNLLEFVLHKIKQFMQTFSKKKFASKLLEKYKVDNLIENLLKNADFDLETYEILQKRSQEM